MDADVVVSLVPGLSLRAMIPLDSSSPRVKSLPGDKAVWLLLRRKGGEGERRLDV